MLVGLLTTVAIGSAVAVLVLNHADEDSPDEVDASQCIQESQDSVFHRMKCAEVIDSVVTPGNAEVGQCVNIDEEVDSVFMYELDCDDDHDGEIIGVAEVDVGNLEAIETNLAGHCSEIVSTTDLVKLNAYSIELDFSAVIEYPEFVSVGDHLVCYVESDVKLEDSVLADR